MFAFIGGKKRPKKTLQGAVKALGDGFEGEKAIFDTETGEIYSLSGEKTVLLTPSMYALVTEVLGLCILTNTNPDFPFPAKTATDMITKMGPTLAGPSVKAAARIYTKLWSKNNGQSGPERSE
jgi:hypothetical protein